MAEAKNEKKSTLDNVEKAVNDLLSLAEKTTKIVLPIKDIISTFQPKPIAQNQSAVPAITTDSLSAATTPAPFKTEILLIGGAVLAALYFLLKK